MVGQFRFFPILSRPSAAADRNEPMFFIILAPSLRFFFFPPFCSTGGSHRSTISRPATDEESQVGVLCLLALPQVEKIGKIHFSMFWSWPCGARQLVAEAPSPPRASNNVDKCNACTRESPLQPRMGDACCVHTYNARMKTHTHAFSNLQNIRPADLQIREVTSRGGGSKRGTYSSGSSQSSESVRGYPHVPKTQITMPEMQISMLHKNALQFQLFCMKTKGADTVPWSRFVCLLSCFVQASVSSTRQWYSSSRSRRGWGRGRGRRGGGGGWGGNGRWHDRERHGGRGWWRRRRICCRFATTYCWIDRREVVTVFRHLTVCCT